MDNSTQILVGALTGAHRREGPPPVDCCQLLFRATGRSWDVSIEVIASFVVVLALISLTDCELAAADLYTAPKASAEPTNEAGLRELSIYNDVIGRVHSDMIVIL